MSKRVFVPSGVILLVLLSLTAIRAADAKPDDEGFIRDWLFLGPIPLGEENAGADHIEKKQIEDEGAIKPKAGDKQKVGDTEATWKAIQAKDYYFDLNQILGGDPQQNVLGYLVTYVVADNELPDLVLLMSSN